MSDSLTTDQVRVLFARCVAALNYRALRLEISERQFALLLVSRSFGQGRSWGMMDTRLWRTILCENDDKSKWRLGAIHSLLKVFVQKGWAVTDATAGTYHLRPDQWPCWREVQAMVEVHEQLRFVFDVEADLKKMLAEVSQESALRGENWAPAKNSQPPLARPSRCEKFAVPDSPPEKPRFAGVLQDSLRKTGDLTAPLKELKEVHKGIKPLMDFEALSAALIDVEMGNEATAYAAMCGILGGVVMEGGDLDSRNQVRLGDGGKWRNWWTGNRRRTHRALCSLVEEIKEGTVKSRGARGHQIMTELSGKVQTV